MRVRVRACVHDCVRVCVSVCFCLYACALIIHIYRLIILHRSFNTANRRRDLFVFIGHS